MQPYLSGDLSQTRRGQGYCANVIFMFLVKRRHFRRSLYLIILLFTIVFILKVQQLLSNLTHYDESSSHLELRWISTNFVTDRFHVDLETVRARKHFADYGVPLVKEPGDLGRRNEPIKIVIPQNSGNVSPENFKYKINDKLKLDNATKYFKYDFLRGVKDFESKNVDRITGSESIGLHYLKRGEQTTTLAPTTKQKDLFLTVLVISRPCNVLLRQAVRKTWAKDAGEFGVWVRFVVGREEKWDDIVDREYNMHHDVIVVEEEDTYENLPNKVLDGFSWVLHQSSIPKFLMKVDDDTIVNLPYLTQELRLGVINTTQILGAICVNSTVIRDPGDKWSVSVLDYPFDVYPIYAFGGGYVMSISAAAKLVEARSKTFDWIHLEDVYVTGILARKSGISHVTHPAFAFWTTEKASACDFVQEKCITSVNHTEKEFYSMYTNIQTLLRTRNLTECSKG